MNLLKHPVTSELLKYKWKTYGLPVFVYQFHGTRVLSVSADHDGIDNASTSETEVPK